MSGSNDAMDKACLSNDEDAESAQEVEILGYVPATKKRKRASSSSSTKEKKPPLHPTGEQFKRRITTEPAHESAAPSENTDFVDSGTTKPQEPKNTRYIDKRLDQVYPARKPNSRFTVLSGKSNFKENQVIQDSGLKSLFSIHLALKNHLEPNGASVSAAKATDSILRQCEAGAKGTQNRFRGVAELSLGSDRFTEQGTVDVDKALKGLAAQEKSGSCSPSSSAGKSGDIKSTSLGNHCSEVHIPGDKVPLDLTLKTAMRIVSCSPMDRFHRLLVSGTFNGMTPFSSKFGYSGNGRMSSTSKAPTSADSYSFHSWIYPQSSLPASVISVLSSSSGGAEKDFIDKRHLAWEDSFRSLYYMLRKSGCTVFYVCTSQFVVIFTAVESSGKVKRTCNAFISQSTRGLRSLLKEHDINFSMPLCSSEVEQISREDLLELSEIEKLNLGQAKRSALMPDVDNSTKSLLAFNGNDSVHGLYDFLLNYRSLLSISGNMDVPVLFAPAPFVNAAISSPQVKCKEIRRVDALQSKRLSTKEWESIEGSKNGVYYSIEIKDAYLPPWIICSICTAMSSEGKSFEASFVTEPNSMGLNAALEAVSQKSDADETCGDSLEDNYTIGTSVAVIKSSLSSSCLKALKYSNGFHVASLSPV